jgi:hypothetical protein
LNAGSLKIYRIYDFAHEVKIEEAIEKLNKLGKTSQYTLKKQSKDFYFGDPPLVLSLGHTTIDNKQLPVMIKIWSYGAVSFSLVVDCEEFDTKVQYIEWLKYWSSNHQVDLFCSSKLIELINVLGKSLIKPNIWQQEEEYSIFRANHAFKNKDFWQEENFLYQFLTMESSIELSEAMITPIKSSSLSYGPHDLVVVDWDNAFVFSNEDTEDICDVIELANVQLLELRFFDNLLDKKLSGLYRQVIERSPTIFNSAISVLAKDASQLYLETSEVVERIENSLKIVGDIYFARIYRLSLARLQVAQWQATVDQKLKNLLDVSQMYMGELHTRRSHFMEIVIIFLIAIEVVPFLYPYLSKLMEIQFR